MVNRSLNKSVMEILAPVRNRRSLTSLRSRLDSESGNAMAENKGVNKVPVPSSGRDTPKFVPPPTSQMCSLCEFTLRTGLGQRDLRRNPPKASRQPALLDLYNRNCEPAQDIAQRDLWKCRRAWSKGPVPEHAQDLKGPRVGGPM